ncbi:MAG: pyridoxal phosphate-dependent aminotransferase [Ignavibacteria bacterium]|jgi:aspartate aminotransferase|nr:pyridoxal phosphate-dependent aminotransferase [Ignavibacteria bacterium]MCU7504092.1 pyridoxal phosphate-dependent aminotransferase [Ignavibacteria bacterium]MCU7516458.1 pyridoxal phosphate-dependent aminotransferase [Ignavibacteria bacterium]
MRVAAKAIIMKAEGVDLVDFSVGEPDFPTPEHIKEAAKIGINNNFTKYTVNEGMVELRIAIAEKLKRENNLDYDPKDILVSNGAKQALFNAVMALVDNGDEVLIPAPYYVSYPEMVKIAGGKPVILKTRPEDGFKLLPGTLKSAINEKTKALILCSPSNPTGLVYTESELKGLAEVIEEKNICVISDEVYEKLIYDDIPFTSMAAVSPKLKELTAVVNGLSKSYAMTGWRIGYVAGRREVIAGASKLQSHSTSGASSVSQYAGIAALSGPQDEISVMTSEFKKRRDYIYKKLTSVPGIKATRPSGAFYIFPDLSGFYGKAFNGRQITNSSEMALFILEEAKVAVVPGIAFGEDNYIRISYSTSMENIVKGVERIISALGKLK